MKTINMLVQLLGQKKKDHTQTNSKQIPNTHTHYTTPKPHTIHHTPQHYEKL